MNDVIWPALGEAVPMLAVMGLAVLYVWIDNSPRLNRWLTDKIVAKRDRKSHS